MAFIRYSFNAEFRRELTAINANFREYHANFRQLSRPDMPVAEINQYLTAWLSIAGFAPAISGPDARGTELLEINSYRLIEQSALKILILGLFGKALQPEETGSITFLDGNFQVTGGVE